MLEVICRTTGMGFAAVARVTENRWIACSVRDEIAFGLQPGGELTVETTLCHEVRQSQSAVVIDHVADDPVYRAHHTPATYGFQSYISMPIVLAGGEFFGTLCAIDPRPARINTPETIGMFKLFAELIAFHLKANEQLAASETVRRSDAFAKSLLAASPDSVQVLSTDGVLEFINDRGVELNQFSAATDVLGQKLDALWPEQERAKVRDAIHQAASGQVSRMEGFCPTAKNQPRWWKSSFASFQPTENGPFKIVCVTRDATERIQARASRTAYAKSLQELNETLEQRVREATQERDRIWRLSGDLILVAGLDGTIKSLNPAWRTVLGWHGSALISTSFLDLVHPDDLQQTRERVRALTWDAAFTRVENRYRHADGTYRWISWTAVPDTDVFIAIGRDCTVEKEKADALHEAEERLRQSQKMEAVGQLTGGLAHDFNNLLTGIAGSLELLQMRIGQGRLAEADRYIDAAQGAARRAASLTHRLLAFSRRQTLDPKPIDVNRLVADMQELLQRTVGPSIELENGAALRALDHTV